MRIRLGALGRERGRYVDWGMRFFLAAALTAAQLPGGAAPFALGCTAACGSGAPGAAALLGTALGALLFLKFSAGLPHMAAAVLICTASAAMNGLGIARRRWFPALCAAGLYLAVDGIYVLQAADPAEAVGPCLTAAALAGAAAYGYAPLLRAAAPPDDPWPMRVLLASLCAAFTGLTLGQADLGRAAGACLAAATAWQYGSSEGMCTGLCAGLAADLCSGAGLPLRTAAYGLGGLASGVRTGRSRLGAALAFLCGAAALLPLSQGQGEALPAEALAGMGLFLLLPGRLFGGKRLQRPEPQDGTQGLRDRLTRAAAAFRDLYDSLGRAAPRDTEENPAVIFDRAAEKVCRDCSLCRLCWKEEYVTTFNALNDATPFLLERGRALGRDFPRHFADRCIHLPELLAAVNGELSAYLLRRSYRRRLEESRRSARGQYAQLGELLSATAAGLGEVRPAAAGAGRACPIGAALRPKDGERVCGDSVGTFATEAGLLCLLLSDGCGSGESARRESALTCRLLRQFLEAGVEPEAALKTLNGALALRSEETGSFATVDLLTVSPASGEAVIYKYGAAPTYVKKGGSVRRITGNALPVGLRRAPAAPDVTRLTLEEGSFVVMVSDGVADALRDDWLQDLLAGWDGGDPQELAGLVVQEAVGRTGLADDCGAQVLLFPPREGRRRV